MTRFVVGASALVAALALALPAQASVVPEYTVSGSFSGATALDNGSGCSFIHQTVSAAGDITPFGPSTSMALAYCVVFGSPYTVIGSYQLVTTDGQVDGQVTGQVKSTPTDGLFPYHFDLTVDSGVGKFADATGSMALDGSFGVAPDAITGTASGTISFGTPIATTKQDCKNGGWRSVTDGDGQPFRNEGLCVAFVGRG